MKNSRLIVSTTLARNHVFCLLLLIHAFFLYFLPHHTPIPTHLIYPIYAYFRKSDYYTYIAGLSSNNEKTSGVFFLAPFDSIPLEL